MQNKLRISNSKIKKAIWIAAFGCLKLQAGWERLNVYHCLDEPLWIDEVQQVPLEVS